ncbi:MAG: TetR/AcrR family transcriptional regulator [Phycicoccus sp.]
MSGADQPSTGTRVRLLEAALAEVAERGPRGATTRRIADRAGVNEATVFRHFGSKDALVGAAVATAAGGFGGTAAEPTGDLPGDLRRLAESYWRFVGENQGAMERLLPELRRDPALGEAAGAVLQPAFAGVLGLFDHYRTSGELVDDDPENLALAFLGPLTARGLLADVLGFTASFEPTGFVAGYLRGYRAVPPGEER